MDYWRYLCNAGTRPECLQRQLVGDTKHRSVTPSDTIILYDYSENRICGPINAITACEKNLESDAWRGKYPYQVRVTWEKLYRITSSKFPRIESNETLSRNEFQQIVDLLQDNGERLIIPEWGSRAAALADDVVTEPDDKQFTAARKELEAQLDLEPPDTEPIEYMTVEQVAREEAFRRAVREAYGKQCAVCGVGVRHQTVDRKSKLSTFNRRVKGDQMISETVSRCVSFTTGRSIMAGSQSQTTIELL